MQQSTQRAIPAPWSPFGALPLPLQPRGRTEALARGLLRLEALREEMIAKAIAELDALQGDPDLEEGGDLEPSNLAGSTTDREADDADAEEDDPAEDSDPGEDDGTAEAEPDGEPELGWSEGQSLNGKLSNPEKPYAQNFYEPSLGSLGGMDQRRWSGPRKASDRDDGREEQCEDEGAQCEGEGDVRYTEDQS